MTLYKNNNECIPIGLAKYESARWNREDDRG